MWRVADNPCERVSVLLVAAALRPGPRLLDEPPEVRLLDHLRHVERRHLLEGMRIVTLQYLSNHNTLAPCYIVRGFGLQK